MSVDFDAPVAPAWRNNHFIAANIAADALISATADVLLMIAEIENGEDMITSAVLA